MGATSTHWSACATWASPIYPSAERRSADRSETQPGSQSGTPGFVGVSGVASVDDWMLTGSSTFLFRERFEIRNGAKRSGCTGRTLAPVGNDGNAIHEVRNKAAEHRADSPLVGSRSRETD